MKEPQPIGDVMKILAAQPQNQPQPCDDGCECTECLTERNREAWRSENERLLNEHEVLQDATE